MPLNIRSLIFVLALSVPAFYIARQLAGPIVPYREFAVWRNAWFAITAAGFLSGSFFVFSVMTTIICLYARSARAATPAIFFMLLFAVPMTSVSIRGFGIVNWLFDINNARLLSIVLLIPILFAMKRLGRRNATYSTPDWLIVGYVFLNIARQFGEFNVASIMRVVTVETLDILMPYFVFSRAVTSIADLRKVFLGFAVAMLPLSLIAVFESVKDWHPYSSIVSQWGSSWQINLRREGMLRATATSISPIALGYINMVAIGCVLAIWHTSGMSQKFARLALAMFTVALVATLSRGPWVGAAILVLAYLAIGPSAVANFGRFIAVAAVGAGVLLITPVGARLIDLLPFVGTTTAEGSVTYRQLLFEKSLIVIGHNPWFGDLDFRSRPEMQELLQGEHIIDIVNTYLEVALSSGLVGLGLFCGFFASVLIGLRRVVKLGAVQDVGLTAAARASMATLVAVLVTIATVSSVDTIPYVYWSLAGLCVALVRIAYRERVAVARAAHVHQVPV